MASAMVFLLCNVLVTVEMPQLFIPRFGFGPQTLGVQFLALAIGSIVGEVLGGTVSDTWMSMGKRYNGGKWPANEHRLWLSYPGFLLAICGLAVFIQMSERLAVYNISPIVGGAIAAAGNQLATTVLITYSVDCYPQDAAGVGVFVTFARQIWGFIGPFW